MNNQRDNGPSMDYYELRRRHEEFKQRQASQQHQHPAPAPKPAAKPQTPPAQPVEEPIEPEVLPVREVEEPVEAPQSAPIEPELAADDGFDEASDEAFDDGFDDAEPVRTADDDFDALGDPDLAEDNPNPFGTFIHLFHDIRERAHQRKEAHGDFDEELDTPAPKKSLVSLFSRKKKAEEDYLDYDDSDFADENYVKESFPDEPADEPADESVEAPPFEEADTPLPAADIEDAFDDEPPITRKPEPADDGFDDFEDNGFDDIDEVLDDEGDDSSPKGSGFKRFLSLFIVREDDGDMDDDYEPDDDEDMDWDGAADAEAEDDWEDAPRRAPINVYARPATANDGFSSQRMADDIEGGSDMDEKNKLNIEMTEQMAEGLESRGMSRRERRELAERLAAEEAAKRAAAQPAPAPEEVVPLTIDSVQDPVPSIVEIPEEPAPKAPELKPVAESIDEPTREFKPLSKKSVRAAKETSLFDIDDEDDQDEDDDEEAPARFPFFRGRKNRDEDEDEDDDEDEDEDEDYDDEDEEDERPRRKSRRSRSARKSRSARYDDDDEDDDEDDYDDDYDDEDDEEDDYDDDYDEDEDYDDEDDRPVGRTILGFFKGLLAVVLVLLALIVALNFLDYFNVLSLDPLFERYYNKAPELMDTLFMSHDFKSQNNNAGDALTSVEQPTIAPDSAVIPSVTDSVPTADVSAEPTDAIMLPTDAPASGVGSVG